MDEYIKGLEQKAGQKAQQFGQTFNRGLQGLGGALGGAAKGLGNMFAPQKAQAQSTPSSLNAMRAYQTSSGLRYLVLPGAANGSSHSTVIFTPGLNDDTGHSGAYTPQMYQEAITHFNSLPDAQKAGPAVADPHFEGGGKMAHYTDQGTDLNQVNDFNYQQSIMPPL